MPILAFLSPIISKALELIPDPVQRAQQLEAIMRGFQEWDAQQNKVNEAEAANSNLFVSGWRPFIGWICGSAFAYKFVFQPFLIFALIACGSSFDYHKLPTLDWSEMSTVLLGLLGLGGMRSFEKYKGVSR